MTDRQRTRWIDVSRARTALLVLASAGALLASTAVAEAGTYHVYSCRTPAGVSAPTDGWSPSSFGSQVTATDGCATGGSLDAVVGGAAAQPANGATATWGFTAPPQTMISAATLWRSGAVSGLGYNAAGVIWIAAPRDAYDSADVFDRCVQQSCTNLGNGASPYDPSNRVAAPQSNLQSDTQIYATAECEGNDGQSCPATGGSTHSPIAALHIYAADITLADNSTPTVSNVSGSLATDGTLTGRPSVAFDASDGGPGLYQVVFLVDGGVIGASPINTNGGRCVDVAGSGDGHNAFLYGQPCLPAATVNQVFDSSQVPDGPHDIVVQVTDAAGNATTVLDRHVTFHNGSPGAGNTAGATAPGPPNGVNASDHAALRLRWSRTSAPTLTSSWGHTRRIVGRLTNVAGQPITQAALTVVDTPSSTGARRRLLGRAMTAADGRFSFLVSAATPSAAIAVLYSSHVGDTRSAAAASLRLLVHAGLTLTITPRVSGVGQSIAFRGVLRGAPVPVDGKQLVLEARQPGAAWIQFRVIRTSARGAYRASYRFRFPGPVEYQFRALSRYEAAFPFIEGASNVVSVAER